MNPLCIVPIQWRGERGWNQSCSNQHPGPWGMRWLVTNTTITLVQSGCLLWWTLGSGVEHTQMASNNAGRGLQQQSPKQRRRELPFCWIFPGWSDVLMESLSPASKKLQTRRPGANSSQNEQESAAFAAIQASPVGGCTAKVWAAG